MADRFTGPPRHLTIHPPLPWLQLLVCAMVMVLIGFWLAVGHS